MLKSLALEIIIFFRLVGIHGFNYKFNIFGGLVTSRYYKLQFRAHQISKLMVLSNKISICIFSQLKHFGLMTNDPLMWWKAVLGVTAASIVGFFVVRAFHSSTTTR